MPCVNADGTVTAVARQVLDSLEAGGTVEQAAEAASLPLYRVRASLRELVAAGLVIESGAHYTLSEDGKRARAG